MNNMIEEGRSRGKLSAKHELTLEQKMQAAVQYVLIGETTLEDLGHMCGRSHEDMRMILMDLEVKLRKPGGKPGHHLVDLPTEKIIGEYPNKRSPELALENHTSEGTVLKRLKEAGVEVLPPWASRQIPMEEAAYRYTVKKESLAALAKDYHVGQMTMWARMKKFGVKMRPRGPQPRKK